MANYGTLKAAIEAAIRTNGQQLITGQSLQTQLVNMVTALGKFFQSYGGVVTSASTFTAGDENVLFFATEAGTYTDFGGAVLDGKTLHILYYDGSWHDADTLIPSGAAFEAALALAIKGSQSGIAEGIADTISAGTAQEFLQRPSGGDGVNCIKRIKGKTIAWNQLVDEDTTEVTIPSGHKYFAIIGGTASVATSDGTAIAVTGGVDIVTDLTLLGLGDLTADQFKALYPALYYAANAGVLKSNDAKALLTDGRNQWDEEWENGYIDVTTGENKPASSTFRSKNFIPIIAGKTYYVKQNYSSFYTLCYDANKNYLGQGSTVYNSGVISNLKAGTAYIRFYFEPSASTTSYNNDICVNISDPSFNGTYEPYWKRVLALRLSELTGIPEGGTEADRVTMFPNGAGGAGSAFDSLFVENGVTKARKTMLPEVDLGDLTWVYESGTYFQANLSGLRSSYATLGSGLICSKYVPTAASLWVNVSDKEIGANAVLIRVFDSAYTDAATFKTAMSGVKLIAEAATPIVYTDLQYADGTPFTMPATILVDNGGTERIQAPEGSTTPSAPFCCDSNYSIGVANLVKRLAALENAE